MHSDRVNQGDVQYASGSSARQWPATTCWTSLPVWCFDEETFFFYVCIILFGSTSDFSLLLTIVQDGISVVAEELFVRLFLRIQ